MRTFLTRWAVTCVIAGPLAFILSTKFSSSWLESAAIGGLCGLGVGFLVLMFWPDDL